MAYPPLRFPLPPLCRRANRSADNNVWRRSLSQLLWNWQRAVQRSLGWEVEEGNEEESALSTSAATVRKELHYRDNCACQWSRPCALHPFVSSRLMAVVDAVLLPQVLF